MLLLAYLCALAIGLTLGMLGGGGSILTVPVFVYVLHYDPKLAIAMSLPVVGATSLVGAFGHWRAGNLHVASALIFGMFAMVGAFTAARLSPRISGRAQLLLLGSVMMVGATLMLRSSFSQSSPVRARLSPLVARVTLPLVGLGTGALTGLVGIGGGFLIVPALVALAQVPMRRAVGTSLLIITMNSVAGFAGQHRMAQIPLRFVITFSAVAMAGIVVGTRLSRHVEQRTLKRAFALLLLSIAAWVVWKDHALL
ncbi:MAG TPA: sulfite exporter TauE/SafE family protein [Gemmatimonadaceae bacterium]|nr:sulfite exporter TauE/SafE family protein [Gemmatimonadaceae bacterium]